MLKEKQCAGSNTIPLDQDMKMHLGLPPSRIKVGLICVMSGTRGVFASVQVNAHASRCLICDDKSFCDDIRQYR